MVLELLPSATGTQRHTRPTASQLLLHFLITTTSTTSRWARHSSGIHAAEEETEAHGRDQLFKCFDSRNQPLNQPPSVRTVEVAMRKLRSVWRTCSSPPISVYWKFQTSSLRELFSWKSNNWYFLVTPFLLSNELLPSEARRASEGGSTMFNTLLLKKTYPASLFLDL